MDSFLFIGDYAKQIQSDELSQIIGNNYSILDGILRAAVEETQSYLRQKYDISSAFNPVLKYDPTATYNAGQTIYLDATDYDATATYAVNDLTLESGSVYKCTTAITAPESFNSANWLLLGAQYDLFYVPYPQPIFNYLTIYAVDDQVFWKDNVYTCQIATEILDHDALLQGNNASVNEIQNIFPDDKKKGKQYWGTGTAYSLSGSDLTKFTAGDFRDQKLVEVVTSIALYKANMRIAPRNIPQIRIINYMGNPEDREIRGQRVLYPTYCALGWLQAASIGDDVTPSMPLIQPDLGSRTRFGGNQKQINSY